ncbi:RDD family protein [Jatrophihabitans fulvus]
MTSPSHQPQKYKGERLGLPDAGVGSLAPTGPRVLAFLVDALIATVIAALFVRGGGGGGFADQLPRSWSLLPLAVDYVVGCLFFGRTLGMYLFGLRLIRVDRNEAVGPGRILLRTLLLFLLVPAVIFDRDNRGLHDRFTDTAVVRGK